MRIFSNKYRWCRVLLCAAFFTLHSSLFTSCEQDNYDKGEGEYSLMRADFVEAHVGSEAEIFGEHNDLDALAAAAGTISYELLCAVSKRVPRVYTE